MNMKVINIRNITLTVLSLLVMSGCFQKKFETAALEPNDSDLNKIIGGIDVNLEDPLSKNIAMLLNTETSEICTATLIEKYEGNVTVQALLTAGHCVPSEKENLNVYFDLNPLSENSVTTPAAVENIITHQEYSRGKVDSVDLAIVFLQHKFPSNFYAVKINTKQFPLIGKKIYLAGYGNNSALVDSEGFGKLRKVETIISSLSEGFIEVDQSNGKGICDGDSGGPAFIKRGDHYILVGVSKLVYDKNNTGRPSCLNVSKFTSTAKYYDWILKVLMTSSKQP